MGGVLSVPRSWAEVTAPWMTAAVASRLPGAVVGAVEVVDSAAGTNTRARALLSYSAGTGPASVFVKRTGRFVNRLALVALGAFGIEARLALSGEELPIERPQSFAGAVAAKRLASVVVMDDVLADGRAANSATSALSVAEVRSGLEGLASLHAKYWNRPLPTSLGFLSPWRFSRAWSPVSAASLTVGLRRLKWMAVGQGSVRRLNAGDLARQFRRSALLAASGDRTVLHGDPHPGNSYALPDGRTGFLDWELARTGNWSHDVGYFLVGSLSVEDRREHERTLLEDYLDALRGRGVTAPAWDAAWSRYRATPAYGLPAWLHTIAFGTFQAVDVCAATIARFAAAYEDLETGRE